MALSRRASVFRDLAAALVLFLAALYVTSHGIRGPYGLLFQLGPNDHHYLEGFAPHYEVTDGVAVRWSTYDATVDLPLSFDGGPVALSYRFSRVFPETAEVEVYLDESLIDRFSSRGGKVETREVSLAAVSRTPLRLRLAVDSHERRNLGLRLDWIRFDIGDEGVTRLRGAPRWLPPLVASVLFVLFRLGGLSRFVSLALASAFVGCAVACLHFDVFAFAHVIQQLSVPVMLLSALATVILRRMPAGSWVVPIFVAGYLLRGGGLFHPETFYPDVANARDYVEVFRDTSGALAERGVETQTRTGVGYPRSVAGKDYAFPYSPLYFLPFSVFSEPGRIEDAVRHGGLTASTLAVLPLFWIASTIFGPRAGVVASFLWMFLPPVYSRLLLALHATVVGNLLDTLVIASVLALSLRPTSTRRLAAVGVTTLASLLVYTSSLVSVSVFFLFASLLNRRLASKLLLILAASGLVTVGWLYWPFAIAFFTEILPSVAAGAGMEKQTNADPATLALTRIPLFYGYLYPILAGLGLILARRRANERGYRILLAWSLAFASMLGLRAFGAGLFRDLKEITFAAPLVAILAGGAVDALSTRGRWGRVAAAVSVVFLAAFGLSRYRSYLEDYRSPLVSVSPAQTK